MTTTARNTAQQTAPAGAETGYVSGVRDPSPPARSANPPDADRILNGEGAAKGQTAAPSSPNPGVGFWMSELDDCCHRRPSV